MGVYIDIEIPRCCADCPFFVQLAGSDVTECVMPEGRVGQWCPLEDADRKTENRSEKPNNSKERSSE